MGWGGRSCFADLCLTVIVCFDVSLVVFMSKFVWVFVMYITLWWVVFLCFSNPQRSPNFSEAQGGEHQEERSGKLEMLHAQLHAPQRDLSHSATPSSKKKEVQ